MLVAAAALANLAPDVDNTWLDDMMKQERQQEKTQSALQPGNRLVPPDDPLPSETRGRHQARGGGPPAALHQARGGGPPAALLNNFTLDGAMSLEHLFIDDSGTAGCWSVDGRVDCSTVSEAGTMWTSSWITNWTNLVRSVDMGDDIGHGFQNTTMFLRKALLSSKDEVIQKHAVIVGSQVRPTPHAPTRHVLPCARLQPFGSCTETVV